MRKKIVFLLITMVMALTMSSTAEAKKGFYMGLGTAYNSILGDFNGTAVLRGESEVIILPDVNNAFGIDLRAGYGINDQWAVELNLMSSEHSGTWEGIRGNLSYVSFSVNGKYSFTSSSTTQPYLLFGLSGNTLLIKDGATDISTGEVSDATLSGPGFNFGVGVEDYFTPNVSFNVSIMYRYVDYTSASGVNESGSIDDGISGSGLSFLLTTAYHF